MNLLLVALLFVAFTFTLFFTSKLAQLMRAQRHQMAWIFMIWLLGGALTFGFVVLSFDLPVILISLLIILTLLYATISGMDMGSSLFVNFSSLTTALLFAALFFTFFGQEQLPLVKNHMVAQGLLPQSMFTELEPAKPSKTELRIQYRLSSR